MQLQEEQWEALRQLAVAYGVSIAEPICRSIDAWLQQQAFRPVGRRRRALEAIGRFRSGHSDVAEKHDASFAASISGGNGMRTVLVDISALPCMPCWMPTTAIIPRQHAHGMNCWKTRPLAS